MRISYASVMPVMKTAISSMLLLALGAGASADAQRRGEQRRGEQDEAYQGRRSGALRPLREIEGGVVPRMKRRGADYIGAELDGGESRYRLKFVRDGSVIWVDVDGRTGAVVGRAGD